MGMTIYEDLYVLEFESELCNVSFDLSCSLDESAIEQNVALPCRDQERSNFRRADIIKISDDLERRHRLVPAPAGRISLSKCHRDGEENESKRDVDFWHGRA